MITDTAAIRIKNGICQKMIQIDQHRCDQHEPNKFPTTWIEDVSDACRSKKMKRVMNQRLQKIRKFHTSNIHTLPYLNAQYSTTHPRKIRRLGILILEISDKFVG